MAIQMIGIDHTKAVIDIRTIFSFTKKRSAEALKLIKEEKGGKNKTAPMLHGSNRGGS